MARDTPPPLEQLIRCCWKQVGTFATHVCCKSVHREAIYETCPSHGSTTFHPRNMNLHTSKYSTACLCHADFRSALGLQGPKGPLP